MSQTADTSSGSRSLDRDTLRRAAKLLIQAARPESRHLLAGLIWLGAAAGLDALGPVLGKALIDYYLLPREAQPWAMVGLLGGAFVAGSLASLLRFWQLGQLARVAMRSVLRIRDSVYGHVLRLPMSFFDKAITGQLVSRVTNDTEAVKQLYVQVLFVLLDGFIMLGTLLVTMAWLDWRLMLLVALLGPAVFGIVWLYHRLSAQAVNRSRELRSELNARTAESISGMAVLQATGAVAQYRQRYADINLAHYQARKLELRANAWLLRPALDFLKVGLLAAVIGLFAWFGQPDAEPAQLVSSGLAQMGAMQVGVLYAFVSYIDRVIEPLVQITMQFSQLQQAVVAASRVNGLLEETQAARPQAAGKVSQGAVSLRDLSFAYPGGPLVLKHLNLDIRPGEFIGIVGATGSGKSTLLSLLLRFYATDPQALLVDGLPLSELDEQAFREAVGLVPQEPFLLAASVRENISMGRQLDDARLKMAAEAAGAEGFIQRLPQAYDTPLGEGGARLSVGERQLLAIARALAGEPRILLLDEATAHIDSATEQVVQAALQKLRGQFTLIAIAHRLSTVRDADSILVLHHGEVAELGSHEELMQRPDGLYRRLVELQQLREPEIPA